MRSRLRARSPASLQVKGKRVRTAVFLPLRRPTLTLTLPFPSAFGAPMVFPERSFSASASGASAMFPAKSLMNPLGRTPGAQISRSGSAFWFLCSKRLSSLMSTPRQLMRSAGFSVRSCVALMSMASMQVCSLPPRLTETPSLPSGRSERLYFAKSFLRSELMIPLRSSPRSFGLRQRSAVMMLCSFSV